jgi:hypothetical protein
MLELSSARHARLICIAYALVTGVLAGAAALLIPVDTADPVVYFRWITPASIAVIASMAWFGGLWTATSVYALVFWCFHFGLVAVLGSGWAGVEDLSVWELSWLLGPHAADAAILSLAGLLAFACGSALVFARRLPARPPRSTSSVSDPVHAYGAAGSMLVFGTIGTWCLIVISSGGLGGFFGSYDDYRTMTTPYGDALAVIWLVLGLGLVLSVTGRAGGLRTAAAVAFAAFSLVALPLGLRSEVMFRGMAAFVAAARCGRGLSSKRAIALGVALLAVIPIVREVRNTGLSGLPDAVLAPRLYEALAEMGGSLNPVEKVVRWHAEGEPFDAGRSYWAPIERAAARLLPGLAVSVADNDMRITSVLVTDRVGAIGFSPVAEAYRNFGGAGVVLVLGLFGAALAAIDSLRERRLAVFALAIVYVPMLMNIRNTFIFVPAHLGGGVALVAALAAIRHVLGSVIRRPYARPAYIRSEV